MEALKGIKVVEFAAFAAGPVVGKHLADHGATVVHVESKVRPDGFRTHYPPYKDNIHGLNRSGLFALCNNDKLDITLNLKKAPKATELAKRIVAWADVVIENFSPGTMARLGLGYEELKKVKPDLIMLSSSNLGQSGPHAHHAGFGSQLSSLAGFTHLTGYPDGPPQILYGPYIDYIAVAYGAVAILAALDYRRRTGQGNYIDTAQYETGLQYLAPILLDYKVNGTVATRNANRDPHAAPHGAYPCAGDDSWCAISVHSEKEWQALCNAMGNPPWAADAKFASHRSRKGNEDELDRKIAEWTSRFGARELMERLQAAGVKAAMVNTMKDLYSDPQLAARGQWVELEHPEIGKMHYQRPPFLLAKTPPGPARRDPLLGEHNEHFYRQLLGLSADEYDALVAEGVID
ncbi:MAG TPA: CoA transferase [Candidatus Acidoferrales bacterium]|nr:CoA transferase [Candidatus Acidoferrales bacterium]